MTLVLFLHVLFIYNFWKIIWSELIARDTCFHKHQEVVDSIRNWIKYVQRMKNRIDLKTLALVLHFIPFSRSNINSTEVPHNVLFYPHSKVHVIYNNSSPWNNHFNPIISSFFFTINLFIYATCISTMYICFYTKISVLDVCLEYVSIYF